ncbi:hypothetical protein [Photorhabdus bodei]|uniref:hypothetical protein n=1 Tax=Photorhabdus bodei TaxID=2029681 RepID=UPI0018750ED1|nr:hypothetical protein [Photorhabdus bodei]
MSVINFSDKPVDVANVHTWPKSPDRDLIACGRDAYAEKSVQEALSGDPDKAVKLSELNDILASCEPFDFKGVTLYAKDPVLALIKALSEKSAYLVDDSYPPEQWQSGGVDKHNRIKDFIESPNMFIKGIEMIDMGQLYLGNYGFVSTIGAIASHPEGHNLLFSAIYPPVYNPTGVYTLWISRCIAAARERIPGSIDNYVTGVSECSQQRGNLKDDRYIRSESSINRQLVIY